MSVTLTGTVTNAGGAVSAPSQLTIVPAPVIDTFTVAPASGPAGTTYTITMTAHDTNTPASLASASLVRSDGGTVTPVSGQPAGTYKWTTVI